MRSLCCALLAATVALDACGDGETPASTPLPRAATFVLPDTGQVTSGASVFGADSDYRIHWPAYQDSGDGTVTDLVTGLVWQREDDPVERPWSEAVARCGSLALGGKDDWRLPEFMELLSIANAGGPLVDPAVFPRTGYGCFWSATPGPREREGSVWVVDWLVRGVGGIGSSSASCRTRCVRGLAYPLPAFRDDGGVTVTDLATGLVWQQPPMTGNLSWTDALAACEALELAGHADWRLPNLVELASTIDTGRYWPSLDPRFFSLPAGASDAFWASTQAKPNAGWVVRYFDGALWDGYDDRWRVAVRCVRDGS